MNYNILKYQIEPTRSILTSIADEYKLMILSRLCERDMTRDSLAESCGFDVFTIQSALNALTDAGIVTPKTDGRVMRYTLCCSEIFELLSALSAILSNDNALA